MTSSIPEKLRQRASYYSLDERDCSAILTMLDREPNDVELAVIGAMWSEHCSYKSSANSLRMLPTKGQHVICGPGENAGVVDIGGGYGIAFKIESHNHPSVIEPYQGAATGVGGILRDVFTMGARPIALLNALWFGPLTEETTLYRLDGVTRGIADYGNAVGVPTVAGETGFHVAYKDNILVNAMAVGLVELQHLMLSKAAGVGNLVLYGGGRTGRDGVKGAVMASNTFAEEENFERTTVQIADPFCGKCLIEACQELVRLEGVVAMQDMGAAGLTSSSVEMADKGELGMELWLDQVPVREENLQPYELMLSESQERMLLVVQPDAVEAVLAIFAKYDLVGAVVGKMIPERNLVMMWQGEIEGVLPLSPLASLAPRYDRERSPEVSLPSEDQQQWVVQDKNLEDIVSTLMQSVEVCSKRRVWEQYDRYVGARFLSGEEGDAAVLDVWENQSAIALSLDSNPYYGMACARAGGRAVVCENWRNLVAVGSQPLAFTDNLNAGNPENPDVMRDFVATVAGMSEAAEILQVPFVSGNVSLYNTTGQASIPQTPVVGGVGLMKQPEKRIAIKGNVAGAHLMLWGSPGSHLGSSLYTRLMNPHADGHGMPPYRSTSDVECEHQYGTALLDIIDKGLVQACHDISEGGLMVALLELLLINKVGADITVSPSISDAKFHPFWFGEDPARYLICTHHKEKVQEFALAHNLSITVLGTVENNLQMLLQSATKGISLEWVEDLFINGLERHIKEAY